nr:2-oxo-4-hydroxy-4-carboxy-5-ureidoimidazoline decarboxylase [Nesterenkonia alkaliphila]
MEAFNTAEAGEAGELLEACAPIASWRAGLLARRPYSSREEMLETAASLAGGWTDQEVDAALAHHPRIGERASGNSAEAQASRAEQGSLSEDEQARQEWLAANRDYEEKFGRIFLIRAKGRSSAQMLAALRERLENDDAAEARIRREQLAEIALLRLQDAVPA